MSVSARLARLSIPEPNSGCWLWLGSVFRKGYGKIKIDGVTYQAHRIAWAERHGPISCEQYVCHKCDVSSCINPDHLWIGGHADNMADMTRKKRRLGGNAKRRKLSREDAQTILDSKEAGIILAQRFNVASSTISMIRTRRIWEHLGR